MIRSMTGIGEVRLQQNGVELNVFIRSVNQKSVQLQIRMPRILQSFESNIRREILSSIGRGKIDVSIDVISLPLNFFQVTFNQGLAEHILRLCRQIAGDYSIPEGLSAESLLRFPELLSHLPDNQSLITLWPLLERAIKDAIANLLEFRRDEGNAIQQDFMTRIGILDNLIQTIEGHASRQRDVIRERIHQTLASDRTDQITDLARIDQEIVIQALRADITEEITRFRSHLTRLHELIDSPGQAGRKADILLQELNREINTIGSKSMLREISDAVVDAKVEIDRIREQIQNVE